MIECAPIEAITTADEYGGKAFGLAELHRCGARIPSTLCLRMRHGDETDAPNIVRRFVESWQLRDGTLDWIVRSSSAREDARLSSSAGLFSSRRFSANIADIGFAVAAVLAELASLDCESYVLQPYISGEWSGVAFSTDPAQLEIGHGMISYVAGDCAALVQGTGAPHIVVFDEDSPIDAPDLAQAPAELRRIMRLLEQRSHMPVDCEFTIDSGGSVWFLQARPIASVVREAENNAALRIARNATLPPRVVVHPKVALRLRCLEAEALISTGLVIQASVWRTVVNTTFPPGRAYTAVLLHPRVIDGAVQRRFSADGVSGAQYVLDQANSYWIRYAIVAEVLVPRFTGIMSLRPGEAVIEIARGHYVPKGLVPTTVYTVKDSVVVCLRAEPQTYYFDIDFTSGQAIRLLCDVAESPIEESVLLSIADLGRRVSLTEEELLEFGFTADGMCYVIDIQGGSSSTAVPAGGAVVSVGSATGTLVCAPPIADGADEHYLAWASQFRAGGAGEPVIVVAATPQLGLVKYFADLAAAKRFVVGVIFEVYSPLCHLALLLREWQIPAIAISDYLKVAIPSAVVRVTGDADGIAQVTVLNGAAASEADA